MPLSSTTHFLHVLEHLEDPDAVKASMLDPANHNPDPIIPDFPQWNDLSLADGYPGLLLLFANLQRVGLLNKDKEGVPHQYVLKIKEALETGGCDNFSLFSGIAGICFSLQQASCEGTRYQKMLYGLHDYLLKNIERLFLEPMRYNIRNNEPSPAFLHDPIQGIAGIGRYLLENLSLPNFFECAQDITTVLVNFSQPLTIEGKDIPGWFSSPNDPLNSNNLGLLPKGNFNLGLAHGITGTLAFLAIAKLRGVEVPGLNDAILRIATWIREKSHFANETIQWPYNISWDEQVGLTPQADLSCKDAWCYGVPGIARTLFLAAKALNNDALKEFAVQAFAGVFQRSQSSWGLPGPMLCHGIAGLLLITKEMAKEKGCGHLVPKTQELEEILLSFYHPDFLFGFKDAEPCKEGGTVLVNKVGFLNGAAGVLLSLLQDSAHSSKWYLPFLIND